MPLASRKACSGSARAARVMGQAPTTVWGGAPQWGATSRGAVSPTSRGVRLSRAASRARTSPLRLVSCASSRAGSAGLGQGSRFARWKASTESEKRPGRRNLVQRREPEPAVERRILDPFSDWPGGLRSGDELGLASASSSRSRGGPPGGASASRSSGSTRPDTARRVGAVGSEAAPGSPGMVVSFAAAARAPAGSSSAPARASPRRPAANGRPSPVTLLVQPRERLLAGRVDEERRDVVQELVAGRPLDRPVAQKLARLEDLLHPDVLDPPTRSRSR